MRRVSVLIAVIVAVGCAAPVPEPAEVAPETAVETGYADGGYAEGEYAEFGQSRIYYEIEGQGPPLILIHGGLLDGRMWDGQFDMFAGRYRVIRYDASGHGRSAAPPDAYYDHEDLFGLMAHLELDMPDIHGIANLLAAANPNARIIQIDGVAHMVNMEAPEEFNRVASAYLEKLGY